MRPIFPGASQVVVRAHFAPRGGITLVEMLVAMAITLLLMATVVQVFDLLGTAVAGSRSTMEMTDQLRQAQHLLQSDLAAISRPVVPWVTDDEGGYFEYIEGDATDVSTMAADSTRRFGDADDGLFFTARSADRPFQGNVNGNMIESPEAEIAWVCIENTTPAGETIRTIHRRVLLVAPWAASLVSLPTGTNAAGLAQFQSQHDLSARLEGGDVVLNTIHDLALRENRFMHDQAFPHGVFVSPGPPPVISYNPLAGARLGEDVVLRNALAFDVRIFDPGAPLHTDAASSIAVGPADPGFATSSIDGFGAYVDLGYSYSPASGVAVVPAFNGPSTMPALGKVFDTWPAKYESDGKTQVANRTDWSTNGFDDDAANGVDDLGERETVPPYFATPQGVQVKLRAYETDARQIREVTVNQNFAH